MGYLEFGIVALGVVLITTKIWQLCWLLLWRPYALTKHFEKQGIRGPPYFVFYGSSKEIKKLKKDASEMVLDVNSNDINRRVFPHYHQWSSIYGETFLYWYGTQPRITIVDPELAKQVLSNKFGYYVKPRVKPSILALVGRGLIMVSGRDWVRHRRILNPAFSMDKLKIMIKKMAACTTSMLDDWKDQAEVGQDKCIKKEVNQEFTKLGADIIAHTGFGSSYVQGKEAFQAQKELQRCWAEMNANIFIPGSQYLPTPTNIKIWKLGQKIKEPLRQIIESKIKTKASGRSDGYGDDLLGLMIEASEKADDKNSPSLNMNEIIDECKTFFFAGHDTTSNLLTWTLFLLSIHQEWQEKLRQEVLKECGMEIPDADSLTKLKMVNVVLLEVLRLYCPAIELFRKATEDMKLGDLMIPKDTYLTIAIPRIHRNKEYWGEDANEFKPLRFINGVSKAAKHPNAFLAFAIGPRACIGQNFAMLEAKTVLAMVLQRFSFTLSPEYKHAPADILTLQPEHGLPLNLKLLE